MKRLLTMMIIIRPFCYFDHAIIHGFITGRTLDSDMQAELALKRDRQFAEHCSERKAGHRREQSQSSSSPHPPHSRVR